MKGTGMAETVAKRQQTKLKGRAIFDSYPPTVWMI